MNYKKNNILFLYWGRKGGGAKYSYEIAKELSLRTDVNLHLSISRQCELLNQFKSLSRPILFVNTYNSISEFLYKWIFRKSSFKVLLENYFRDNQIESVIIGMDFFWSSVIYKAARNAGVQSILVVHEPKPHPQETAYMAVFKNFTLKKAITGADHLVTLTKHVKTYILNEFGLNPDNISVIPHGIFAYYNAKYPKSLPAEPVKIRILYFGRIEYYKGLDILLKAFQALENQKNNVQLEIHGAGNLSGYAMELNQIENIRIENRWIDEDEIAEVFENCHVCVLPYREASQSGIVGIASSAAMPIVASPSKGLIEQLEGFGALISKGHSPESLKDAILELIEDPGLYQRLSETSLRYSQGLGWDKIASQFQEISMKLISDRKK